MVRRLQREPSSFRASDALAPRVQTRPPTRRGVRLNGGNTTASADRPRHDASSIPGKVGPQARLPDGGTKLHRATAGDRKARSASVAKLSRPLLIPFRDAASARSRVTQMWAGPSCPHRPPRAPLPLRWTRRWVISGPKHNVPTQALNWRVAPAVRIELTTYRLQGGCSTAELSRRARGPVVCRVHRVAA